MFMEYWIASCFHSYEIYAEWRISLLGCKQCFTNESDFKLQFLKELPANRTSKIFTWVNLSPRELPETTMLLAIWTQAYQVAALLNNYCGHNLYDQIFTGHSLEFI